MSDSESWSELRAEWRAIRDLESIASVLDWDQATYMPPGGEQDRGRQLAMLSTLAHERLASRRMAELIAACSALEDGETFEAAFVRRARRKHLRASRVPAELVRTMKQHQAETYVAWTRARPADDFVAVRALLARNLELSRRLADAIGFEEHPLDALMDESDEGATVRSVGAMFGELRAALVPIVERLIAAPEPDDSFLRRLVPADAQLAFAREVARSLGYDFDRGRMDLTHHPFMTRLGVGDVRITTRVREDDFGEAFFSTVHEVGHALYEQGIDPSLDGSPLGEGASAGVHESQSRFWENFVARSLPFWQHWMPRLRSAVRGTFDDVSEEAMHRAVNKVARSLIRTDADEVTYNLHVMLRFDLERAMHEGTLSVEDLPDAWNERMERDLGLRPPTHRDGVLQDVHWFCAPIGGAFQGYTLGNLLAAQLHASIRAESPELDGALARGQTTELLASLRARLHRHGAIFTPEVLVRRATSAPLGIDAFVDHLKSKYGALYGVSL